MWKHSKATWLCTKNRGLGIRIHELNSFYLLGQILGTGLVIVICLFICWLLQNRDNIPISFLWASAKLTNEKGTSTLLAHGRV